MTLDPFDAQRLPRWAAAVAVCGLLILAAAFWKDVIGGAPGHDEVPELQARYYDSATVRKVRTEMTFDGAPCRSCHEGKEALSGNPDKKGIFHEPIKLQHGRNQHCFNCHHRLQPANFSNFDGTPVTLANVQLLCARCHGPTYRDWLAGAHGRRTGFWDAAKGGPKPTVCIACHDPHWPVFKPLTASPPPHVNPRSHAAQER